MKTFLFSYALLIIRSFQNNRTIQSSNIHTTFHCANLSIILTYLLIYHRAKLNELSNYLTIYVIENSPDSNPSIK